MKRFSIRQFPLLLAAIAFLFCMGQRSATAQTNVIITLTGENFTRQSTVFIGTAQFAPEFVSPNTLRVSIPQTMLSSAQPNNVRVVNPSAGGGSSAALPLVVACATVNPIAADFTITIKKSAYHDVDSTELGGRALSAIEQANVNAAAVPFFSRTSYAGKLLNNGNMEITMRELPVPEDPVPARNRLSGSSVQPLVAYTTINTAAGTLALFKQNGDTVLSIPTPKAPFKPLLDVITNALARARQTPTLVAATTTPQLPDSNMFLRAAQQYPLQCSVTTIDAARSLYAITISSSINDPANPLGNITLAPGARVKLFVNTVANNVYAAHTQKLVNGVYKTIHSLYSWYKPDNITLQRTVSFSSYTSSAGTPMVHVVTDDFEEFTITNYLH